MNLSTEETLMYKVMKAIYDSGVPVNFKGSLVLKACLEDVGYLENTRHTVDIDANWYSDKPPTGRQMVDSLQKAMDRSGIPLLVYLNRMHGERRSAGFTLYDKDSLEELFTMDIDVNRPMSQTKIYEIIGIRFRGVIPVYIIADKVFVISTNKVFRRIKDVIDLFYLAHVIPYDKDAVNEILESSGRTMGDFNSFLNCLVELKHAYEKFRFAGDVNKPTFEDVYYTVKDYIKDELSQER